jgi:hypothetical protein
MNRVLLLSVLTLVLTVVEGRAQEFVPPPPPPPSGCGCAVASGVVVNAAPCCPAPGLFPRLRERLRGAPADCCTSCPPRPGLLQRIRDRVAERRANCTPTYP